jgi:hypothetical protein
LSHSAVAAHWNRFARRDARCERNRQNTPSVQTITRCRRRSRSDHARSPL